MQVEIDGKLYFPLESPKARTWESNTYCSRDDGATLELKLTFETQPDRDKALIAIGELVRKI